MRKQPGIYLMNENYLEVDPLRDDYRDAFIEHPRREDSLQGHEVALLCIDVQYLDAARGIGVFADPQSSGVPPEAQDYYFERLEQFVLPNMRRLQDAFRARGLEVIHCRICSLTRDGRDRSTGHKRLGLLAAPGSKEAGFLPEVGPVADEIVINKTTSGVFPSTWVLFDFRSPYRCHPQNQNGWNRKGLISDKGQRKQAWRVMKEFYEGK